MSEEQLKRYWQAYTDAWMLMKNCKKVTKKHIEVMLWKHDIGVMRRLFCLAVWQISTHSAREDGDSNTTQKNQQFFITFPQSNHIILPQITANLPCTHPKPFSLCSFSGANPPVNSCLLLVRTKLFETSLPPAARSEYQRLFHFNPFTHPNMFNLCSVFISQVVKSKAVRLLINDICQYGF